MEIKIKTRTVLNILLVISWIIFIGICIETGGFLFNAIFALANPDVVPRLWQQVDLSALLKFDNGYYFVFTLIMAIVSAVKAWIFFLIIKILHDKNFNFSSPFSITVQRFIFLLSYISILIGFFSVMGLKYAELLTEKGVVLPDTQHLKIGGADVWLFMAIILFVIAQIFKRGIEIQTENDLTI